MQLSRGLINCPYEVHFEIVELHVNLKVSINLCSSHSDVIDVIAELSKGFVVNLVINQPAQTLLMFSRIGTSS